MKVPDTTSYGLTYRATPHDVEEGRRNAAFEKLSDLFNALQQKDSRFRIYAHYESWPFISPFINIHQSDQIYKVTIDNPPEQALAKIRLLGFDVAIDEENDAGPFCM